MHILRFTFPIVTMVALLSGFAGADDAKPAATGTLTGTVKLPDGKPAAGAEIGLMPPADRADAAQRLADRPGERPGNRADGQGAQGRPIARTQADDAGAFSFKNVQPGSYRVMARAAGAQGFVAATVKAGDNPSLTITLDGSRRAAGNAPGRARAGKDGEINTRPAAGERYDTKLKVGDAAPDFTLASPDGKAEITLSGYKGKKPVVLVFGSFTCPPFRDRVLAIDKMYAAYKDRAEFVMVYTREAHPDSVIRVMEDGKEALKKVEQTDTLAARNHNADLCVATLKLTFPAVVDKEDNKVNAAYAGWPSRLIVVSADGKVAYDGGQGPGGFQPAELQKWLDANLKAK